MFNSCLVWLHQFSHGPQHPSGTIKLRYYSQPDIRRFKELQRQTRSEESSPNNLSTPVQVWEPSSTFMSASQQLSLPFSRNGNDLNLCTSCRLSLGLSGLLYITIPHLVLLTYSDRQLLTPNQVAPSMRPHGSQPRISR